MPNTAKTPLLSVVIPARNEDDRRLTQLRYYLETYPYLKDLEVIIVDDGSQYPLRSATIRHEQPVGYGAALKSGIRKAQGQLILTMDGDGQHNHVDAFRLVDFFLYFSHLDMAIGDRRLKEASLLRLWGRKFLNWTASCFASRWVNDLNSGMRVFKRQIALGYEPILCDGFSYTTTLTLAMIADGYQVDWLPIKVHPRTDGQSHVKVIADGWITLKQILWVGMALRTRRLRAAWRQIVG